MKWGILLVLLLVSAIFFVSLTEAERGVRGVRPSEKGQSDLTNYDTKSHSDSRGCADEKVCIDGKCKRPVTEWPRYIFVQTAQSGSFVSVAGNESLYELTLKGVSPQTIAFSDRPQRIVTQTPMQKFLNGMLRFASSKDLSSSKNRPPKAALEILEADEHEDLAVIELFDPIYDSDNQTLKYNARIMKEPKLSYADFNDRADQTLPETFGPAVLYVDGCPDGTICCYNTEDVCAILQGYPMCWHWDNEFGCSPCRDPTPACQAAGNSSECGITWYDVC